MLISWGLYGFQEPVRIFLQHNRTIKLQDIIYTKMDEDYFD